MHEAINHQPSKRIETSEHAEFVSLVLKLLLLSGNRSPGLGGDVGVRRQDELS
jgi:hypothetical protein